MRRSLDLAKTSTKGGFNLFWGIAGSSVISAVGVMIVAGILSESEYGLFAIALTVPNLIQVIRDLGIDQSLIKYIAQYNQENKPNQIRNIILAGLTSEILVGLALSGLSFCFSEFFATVIFNRPEISVLIQIASLTIFAQSLVKLGDSTFIGFERMQYHSITLVIQAIIKTTIMIILVLSGLGVFGAILGHTIAFFITGTTAIILVYFKIYKNLEKQKTNKVELLSTLKSMFKYGLPLSGTIMLTSFITQFYNFLIAIYLTDQLIGNYQVAVNFAVLVAFFVQPVRLILFPAFSKINAKNEPETLQNVFRFSVKYASLLIVPAAFMVMALSKPAVTTIFGNKYELSPLYLSLYTILFLFTAFGYLSSANLIKSQGRTDVSLKLALLVSIVGIILALILIPVFGIIGLIITILSSTLPSIIISLWWIKKTYNATIDLKISAKIMTASAISAMITYLITNYLTIHPLITLVVGALIYFASYIITAPLIGAINKSDIKNLKEMFKALGPLKTVLTIPLDLIENLIDRFHRKKPLNS